MDFETLKMLMNQAKEKTDQDMQDPDSLASQGTNLGTGTAMGTPMGTAPVQGAAKNLVKDMGEYLPKVMDSEVGAIGPISKKEAEYFKLLDRQRENRQIKGIPEKGFHEENYPYEQDVKITYPKDTLNTEPFYDTIKGLNQQHALQRGRYGWEGADVIPVDKSLNEIIPPGQKLPKFGPGMYRAGGESIPARELQLPNLRTDKQPAKNWSLDTPYKELAGTSIGQGEAVRAGDIPDAIEAATRAINYQRSQPKIAFPDLKNRLKK